MANRILLRNRECATISPFSSHTTHSYMGISVRYVVLQTQEQSIQAYQRKCQEWQLNVH